MFSLRKLFWLVFPATVVLLGIVIILGARQYSLSGTYDAIIGENERALFNFTTVREAVTGALIASDHASLTGLIPAIEELNSTFSKMQETPSIPAELKINFLGRIDLPAMVINMRSLASGDGGNREKLKIQEEMRNIGKYLAQYERILATHTRSRIHNLQLIIIGSMGIIISILSFALILLYRSSILPIVTVTNQLQQESLEPVLFEQDGNHSRETMELIEAIETQLRAGKMDAAKASDEELAQYSLFVEHINNSTNQLNGLINYVQLLVDTDEQLYSAEQRELLEKVLSTSREIEKSWQQI